MRAYLTVVKRELMAVLRERTILIAILIQLFIASFSSVLLVSMLALYDADSGGVYSDMGLGVGLVGKVVAPLDGILSQNGFHPYPFATLDEAQKAFYQGQVEVILVLPEDNGRGLVEMKMLLPKEDALSSMILNALQKPLKQYENGLRTARGISLRYTDLKGTPPTQFEFVYSVILPVLMLFPAFITGGMVIDSLSEELTNNTFETLLSAPLSPNLAIGAKISAAVILACLQCIAWLGLLALNRFPVANAGWVLLLAVLCAAIIGTGAAIITVLLRDRERSQFVFALALLVSTAAAFLMDVSPIKPMARLAIGDYYSGGQDVVIFALFLAGLLAVFMRITRLLKR